MEASRSEKNHFVPGYDHAVPLGQMDSRAEALIKLALIGFSLGLPPKKRVRPEGAAETGLRPLCVSPTLNRDF
jgi:hypothetical protein